MKKKNFCLWIIVLLLLLGIGFMAFGVLLPYHFAQSSMPISGKLMAQQQDGGWMLSWTEVENADKYLVEILKAAPQQDPEVIYREFTDGEASLLLPELPTDVDLTIRVTSAVQVHTLLGEDVRYSEESLEATACFGNSEIAVLDFSVNGDEKTLSIRVQCPEDAQWQYQLLDSSDQILREQILSDPSLVLQFGENAIEIPKAGENYRLRVRTCREKAGLLILGKPSDDLTVTEESLQFRKLNPKIEETLKNTITITWDETRGSHYEVQLLDQGSEAWNTVCQVAKEDIRTYTTCLEPGVTYRYRVVSVDEQGEYPVISEELTVTGQERTKYATVWPVRDLAAYSTSTMGEVVDTALTGTAYCVLEEENGMFAVRINDRICYISSTYCMINLPEYLGGLCNYNITNSVYSIYAVHEFAIPNVTGVVTAGYEDVCQEDGSYLVPLLYPTAKKLLNAVTAAREQGYRLKIYDSFRPYVATREIYDLTSQVMDTPLPDTTYTGVPKTSLELPEPREGAAELTLGWLMTGRYYLLNSFLARGGSAHNLGIALDLTLEKWDTGEQVSMQTSMHDLSQYSVLLENTDMANLLGDIMHGAGFAGLISEWWHFQDDNAKNSLGLQRVVDGINAECWVKDDTGWRYRGAKGGYYAAETATISGTEYIFDAAGYVTG